MKRKEFEGEKKKTQNDTPLESKINALFADSGEFVSLDTISTFMHSVLQNQASFNESEAFVPMIKEIVVCVNEWRETNELDDTVSLEQARIFGEFGATYDV